MVQDICYTLIPLEVHWSKVESVINFFLAQSSLHGNGGVAADVHLIGAEVAMPSGLVY